MELRNIAQDKQGNAMVIVLLIMALLTFVGISTTTFTTTEMQTAANDMRSKIAFYVADGATEVASELVEQNCNCPAGFSNGNIGDVVVDNLDLAWTTGAPDPTDTDRDLHFPDDNSVPHTNVNVGRGESSFLRGVGGPTASGYEGEGKSLARGGVSTLYDIVAQHEGSLNTTSLVRVQWRHIGGRQSNCEY